ncbi:hypothetical protein JAAARDRAFT_120376 [Jaapia argillacea MUCL 33604]|uniref:FAD-binding PCMH-type domain-containing protein n=1 Tax=Jaapia argillacea MUCL 33604 TaxID=933084 RepID=A0A067QHP3_9AGAM|nr:hypothetical protein JAAARDRAFT_120376 [Jaapia argillacea MUCL 33604]
MIPPAIALVAPSALPRALWDSLNVTVGGRLAQGTPVSLPCFNTYDGQSYQRNGTACAAVESGYTSPSFRVENFGAYMQASLLFSRTSTSEQCLLDMSNPSNPQAWTNFNCSQGAIPPYYIEVRSAKDVIAAYAFSEATGVPLTIKNAGHDYKGRSSLKNSLALWTLNLKGISYSKTFVPEGCPRHLKYTAMTVGAGMGWADVYQYADANNFTAIGGYHQTIGASGGWIMGGGHSVLTPVFGLGVDRALEFKIVTPDGSVRTANECQNSDLYWALRGGGGGTFGVVLESSSLVEPRTIPLQVANLSFPIVGNNTHDWFKILINNTYKWGTEGWGGHIQGSSLINVTPLLSIDQAKESLQEVSDYVLSQNGTVVVETLPSWYAFFTKYVLAAEAPVGTEYLLGTRLMPSSLFQTQTGMEQMYNAILNILPYAYPYIVVGTPFLYNHTAGTTSVTPAWYNSFWHISARTSFLFNSTLAAKVNAYQLGNQLVQNFYNISPDSGAYFNEGLVYEPNYQQSYWGPNYDRLLSIKKKYDPLGLLDCWQCGEFPYMFIQPLVVDSELMFQLGSRVNLTRGILAGLK